MAGMRAGAMAALGAVAFTGAAIAGMEKVLSTPDQAAAQPPSAASAAASPPAAPIGADGAGPAGGALSGPAAPPCAPPVRICVQLSGSSAWLLGPVDPADRAGATGATGAVVGPVPVRHGRPDSPTPVGFFPIEFKNAAHVNSATGAPMPFAIFFGGDLALYQAELTGPSAGSVRLPAGFAETFFNAVTVGDLIQVAP